MRKQPVTARSQEEESSLTPPEGACLLRVRVRWEPYSEFRQAVGAFGGRDLLARYGICLEEQYPPDGKEKVEEEIILLNFPEDRGSWDQALNWAAAHGLKPSNPRVIFAIGEDSELYGKVGDGSIISTEGFFFEDELSGKRLIMACAVNLRQFSKPEVKIDWVGYLGLPCDWFAFSSSR